MKCLRQKSSVNGMRDVYKNFKKSKELVRGKK